MAKRLISMGEKIGMYIVTVNTDTCEGCSECVNVCPTAILSLEDEKATVSGDPNDCVGCESCVSVCTSGSITVQEV